MTRTPDTLNTSTKSRLDRALRPLAGATAVLALLLVPSAADAQDSREAQLARERAEKATKLSPYQPNTLERRLQMVERALSSDKVFHPFIGSIYQGGGLAIGPGFRKPFGDTGLITAYAAFSVRSYAAAEAKVRLPEFGDGRVRVELRAERLHAPTVDFYGIGADSSRDLRRSFSMDTTIAGAMGRVQVARHVAVGGSLDWMQTQAEGPSSDALLNRVTPTYRRTGVFAEFDTRTSPGYTRSGDFVRVDVSDFSQVNGRANSFQRADAELQHYIPMRQENQVIALRALGSVTFADDGQMVPFFLLPDLGGPNAFRGYSAWRFRDRNRLLLSGEYRWAAGQLLDMALFLDAGTVARRPEELSLANLQTAYGVGLTLHTPTSTITRISVARSSEGMRVIFSFSPNF